MLIGHLYIIFCEVSVQIFFYRIVYIYLTGGFSGGTVVKNLPANAGNTGLSPGPGKSHMLWSN